jgi:hypothetical protein
MEAGSHNIGAAETLERGHMMIIDMELHKFRYNCLVMYEPDWLGNHGPMIHYTPDIFSFSFESFHIDIDIGDILGGKSILIFVLGTAITVYEFLPVQVTVHGEKRTGSPTTQFNQPKYRNTVTCCHFSATSILNTSRPSVNAIHPAGCDALHKMSIRPNTVLRILLRHTCNDHMNG